ncbi:unnamed protein product [Toxocara canis]|nr:unnamed protein product [Toxocara canis]
MASSVQQVLGEQLLKAAAVVEQQLDQQMERMDNLDMDDIESIRRTRMEELKKKQLEKQEWLRNGHGKYEELPDEPAFFEATKKSNRMVVHFFRPSTERCKIVDMHLRKIAPRHLEARFVCVNVEKSPFLTKRLNIRVLPTLAVVMNSKTVDYIRGFDDLGGIDDFKTETLEWRLSQ